MIWLSGSVLKECCVTTIKVSYTSTNSTSMPRRACDTAQKGLGLQTFSAVFKASSALAWLSKSFFKKHFFWFTKKTFKDLMKNNNVVKVKAWIRSCMRESRNNWNENGMSWLTKCLFFLQLDCLQVEMPKSNRVPALRPKKPKTEAKSVSHEEL